MSTRTEPSSPWARARIAALGLQPHPEGGWYREVYRSRSTLSLPRGSRSLLTVIHFVLPPGEVSAWHLVRADEGWTWVGGDPLELHQLDDAGNHVRGVLDAGAPAAVVPAGEWQAARTLGEAGTHVVCTVAPGFDFHDFRIGTRAELLSRFPGHAEIVRTFTPVP